MSRTPAPTALPWLLRWLLVVGALAGLGIWQGGHCAADMSGEAHAHAHTAAADRPIAPALHGGDGQSRCADTSADTCPDLTATVSSSAVALARPPSDGVRVAVAASPVPPVDQPPRPGITLSHLGVSRT